VASDGAARLQVGRGKAAFTVPAGFETDFASVPKTPVAFLLTADSAHEASAVHDWLYSEHAVLRDVADAVLRESSLVSGVPACGLP
jgi:hypothetical protein